LTIDAASIAFGQAAGAVALRLTNNFKIIHLSWLQYLEPGFCSRIPYLSC
jgi:hypothetical protein